MLIHTLFKKKINKKKIKSVFHCRWSTYQGQYKKLDFLWPNVILSLNHDALLCYSIVFDKCLQYGINNFTYKRRILTLPHNTNVKTIQNLCTLTCLWNKGKHKSLERMSLMQLCSCQTFFPFPKERVNVFKPWPSWEHLRMMPVSQLNIWHVLQMT